jgi:hypothetical protein
MNDVLISVRIVWSRFLRIKALQPRVVLINHELGQVNQLMLQKKRREELRFINVESAGPCKNI